jgi:PAS domain S-box-containing protein
MHAILARQLKRAGSQFGSPPVDANAWTGFLQSIDRAYAQADDDRYLLERSLAISSEEMGELHGQLAAERDTISSVICSLAEGVCAVDPSGIIVFINPEAKRLFHLQHREDLNGQRLSDLVQAKFADNRSLVQVLADSCGAAASEKRLVVAGDKEIFITCMIAPLGQAREGFVITLRDVTERTRLEAESLDLNRRLLEASRQAGMAEIASGVLHNVGNVLNSINVSATIAGDLAKGSGVNAVSKLAALLEANRSRLGTFLENDPAGTRIPEYVSKLADQLQQERTTLLEELSQLRNNVDHIREIIATQQCYAKGTSGGVKESESIATLIDNALSISAATLTRHNVAVIRRLEPLPTVYVERHHVLQILINLLNNAKKAVLVRPMDDRTITVSLSSISGQIQVGVADNGVGMTPATIKRLFQHGFTTDPRGHGFGLHSAALAAKAIGGSIEGCSDGPGQGSIFTLKFPAELAKERVAA